MGHPVYKPCTNSESNSILCFGHSFEFFEIAVSHRGYLIVKGNNRRVVPFEIIKNNRTVESTTTR